MLSCHGRHGGALPSPQYVAICARSAGSAGRQRWFVGTLPRLRTGVAPSSALPNDRSLQSEGQVHQAHGHRVAVRIRACACCRASGASWWLRTPWDRILIHGSSTHRQNPAKWGPGFENVGTVVAWQAASTFLGHPPNKICRNCENIFPRALFVPAADSSAALLGRGLRPAAGDGEHTPPATAHTVLAGGYMPGGWRGSMRRGRPLRLHMTRSERRRSLGATLGTVVWVPHDMSPWPYTVSRACSVQASSSTRSRK